MPEQTVQFSNRKDQLYYIQFKNHILPPQQTVKSAT